MTEDISFLFSSSNCFHNVNLHCATERKPEQPSIIFRLFSECMNWVKSFFASPKDSPKVVEVICRPPSTDEIEPPKETKAVQKRLPIILFAEHSNPGLNERARSKDIRTRYVTFMIAHKDNQYLDYGYGMSKIQSLNSAE